MVNLGTSGRLRYILKKAHAWCAIANLSEIFMVLICYLPHTPSSTPQHLVNVG